MQPTLSEANRLAELETIIERGKETFVEVGTALLEIRDSRLYKEKFKTFENYCQERWGMSRIHAHRMIEAAAVANNLLPIGNKPENEAQARELAALPPEQQRQVASTTDFKRATAKQVRKKVQAILPPKHKPSSPELKSKPNADEEEDFMLPVGRLHEAAGICTDALAWFCEQNHVKVSITDTSLGQLVASFTQLDELLASKPRQKQPYIGPSHAVQEKVRLLEALAGIEQRHKQRIQEHEDYIHSGNFWRHYAVIAGRRRVNLAMTHADIQQQLHQRPFYAADPHIATLRLKRLERVAKSGDWIASGWALREIHECQLFGKSFSFESYCQKRLGFASDSTGKDRIRAAEIAANLDIRNWRNVGISVLLALAPLSDEQQKHVAATISLTESNDRNVLRDMVRELRKQQQKPPKQEAIPIGTAEEIAEVTAFYNKLDVLLTGLGEKWKADVKPYLTKMPNGGVREEEGLSDTRLKAILDFVTKEMDTILRD